MSDSLKTLVIIPARGGSKGLPRKNIAPLGGVPLIAWTIAAAKRAPGVTDVVVSTDDEEIAEVARAWGAQVPFLRPRDLAQDDSLVGDAIRHTLNNLSESYDIRINLFTTHPFRSPQLLQHAIDLNKTHALGVNAATCNTNLPGDFVFATSDDVQPIFATSNNNLVRTHGLFSVSGPFPNDVFKSTGRENFLGRARAIANGLRRFLVPEAYLFIDDPVMLTDIDSADDLRRAEGYVQSAKVPWSPLDSRPLAEQSPFVQEVSPASLRGMFSARCLSSGEQFSLQLPVNPLMMEPEELRSVLNCSKRFQDKEIVVSVGRGGSTADVTADRSQPTIALGLGEQVSLGTAISRHRIAYAWLFCDTPLVSAVGGSIGDAPASYQDGKLYVELTPFQTADTEVFATAWKTEVDYAGESAIYRYDGEQWIASGKRALRVDSTAVQIRRDSGGYYIVAPAETMAIEFQVFRHGNHEPARSYACDPLEFPGVLEYEPAKRCWVNCLNSTLVTGRQKLPPIYRWNGSVFVPAKIRSGAQWNIQYDKTSGALAEERKVPR